MSKLTKAESKLHTKACRLLEKDSLTYDEKVFVLDNWQEGAKHINSLGGAFFTPRGLARDLSIYTPSQGTLIDLCAGIGNLAFHAIDRFEQDRNRGHKLIVCVEINPDYVEVGRKIVSEAVWICADVFTFDTADLLSQFEELNGHPFDFAISNPPFGKSKDVLIPGVTMDLNILAVASELSRCGAFVLPQESCPFKYSGRPHYEPHLHNNFQKFKILTGVDLTCSSIDCSMYRNDWRGVNPNVEIALWDLDEQELETGGKIDIGKWRRTERTAQQQTTISTPVAISSPNNKPNLDLFD
jgi:predicted RNA methylase